MRINLTKRIEKDRGDRDFLLHIVLCSLTTQMTKELVESKAKDDSDIEAEIVLTLNGHELDLEKFIEHWQSQVHRMIKEEANDILSEKFNDLDYLFNDLQERIQGEINKRLEDWEKEKVNDEQT
jgi:hypothetical protein